MKNLGTSYAIGYIIAGLILLPLLIYGVNKLFFQGNDAEKYISNYIQNTEEISIHLDSNANTEYDYKTIKAFLSKGGGKFYLESEKFYSTQQKKYFKIISVGTKGFFDAFPNHIRSGLGFIITVNKDDMKDSNMGTENNPIPVFKAVGNEKPISLFHFDKNDKKIVENYDITQEQYENSVYCHLKYVMPKEEFKKRFESK